MVLIQTYLVYQLILLSIPRRFSILLLISMGGICGLQGGGEHDLLRKGLLRVT